MPETDANSGMVIPGDIDQGFVVVNVSTGNGLFPIEGAHVLITKNTEDGTALFGSLETGPDGKTSVITLPAPDRVLSTEPYARQSPYEIYFVRAAHPNYFVEENHMLQIYGGSTSFLNVDLIPLPQDYREGVIQE